MRIVFLTDIYNHHQSDVAAWFSILSDHNYTYITTKRISSERINLGWKTNSQPSYVIHYFDNEDYCKRIIREADILIYGSVSFSFVKERVLSGKISFCYSERAYKNLMSWLEYPLRAIKYRNEGGKYSNVFLLAASAYATFDYNISFCYMKRTYKWGYFPKEVQYENVDDILNKKKPNSILWVGRLIKWKHPELLLKALSIVRAKGISFCLDIIGTGVCERKIKNLIKRLNLSDLVSFHDPMDPDSVRRYMESSEVFVATSNFNEGWGAVINEAMNSCCAVIASSAMGSVPFLIKDGKNGMIFHNNDINDLANKLMSVLTDRIMAKEISRNAYSTIHYEWNGRIAAERVLDLYKNLSGNNSVVYLEGPCSKSIPISNNWYINHKI